MGINEIIKIGNRIKKIRKEKGITQKEMAKMAGIPYSTYSNYENNNREPSLDQLLKIADALNISLDYLMGLENSEKQEYYLNEETAKLAQEMYEDEDMRSLFDMKRNMPPDRFKAHMDFMKNLYNQEKGTNPFLDATHAIPDASEEDIQYDEDIMDDEDF